MRTRVPLMVALVLVLAALLPATADSRAYVLTASAVEMNGDRSDGTYWLRREGQKAVWQFDVAPLQSRSVRGVYLNFVPLVTNSNGAAGYSMYVRATVENITASGEVAYSRRLSIRLTNPFRPNDADNSGGVGYQTYGYVSMSSSLWRGAATTRVTIERRNFRSTGQLGVDGEALFIGFSVR